MMAGSDYICCAECDRKLLYVAGKDFETEAIALLDGCLCEDCRSKQQARIAELEEELSPYHQDGAEAINAVLAEMPHALLAQKNKRIAELEGRDYAPLELVGAVIAARIQKDNGVDADEAASYSNEFTRDIRAALREKK